MQKFEIWTQHKSPILLPASVTIEWVYDELYQVEGSYGLNTPEETAAAEQAEIEAINRGSLVPLGCRILFKGNEIDALWGVVIEPTTEALVEYFNHTMTLPTPSACAVFALEQARNLIDDAITVLMAE